MKKPLILFAAIFFALCALHCGGGGGGSDSGEPAPDDGDNGDNQQETVNTQKLIGTPFEPYIEDGVGNDIPWSTFVCGQYETDTIDSFPIKIFTAFFTPFEEATIKEGIALANSGMQEGLDPNTPSAELPAYEWTDTWDSDNKDRVIYKVNSIADDNDDNFGGLDDIAGGLTIRNYSRFNGKSVAASQVPDWAIELKSGITDKYSVAHELGHATGLFHGLIDYDNDDLLAALEPDSVMSADGGVALNDYNFMMKMQGQIMLNHLGQRGELLGCEYWL